MNRDKVKLVHDKIRRALRQIEAEEGVKISFSTCRFDNTHYTSRMEVLSTDVKVSADRFLTLSKGLGFSENVIGKTFNDNKGNRYTITDIKTRSPKYPVVASCSDGKSYKFSTSDIKRRLS